MGSLRKWYHQQRVRKKVAHFIRLAVTNGWVTARLSEPTSLRHGRVLVLAPHVDDEALGCGGALLLHRQANDAVHVAYVLADAHHQPVREEEGNRAGAFLGATVHHLRCPQQVEAIANALEPVIRDVRPDVTYVPWLLDNHEGHVAVNHAIAQLIGAGATLGDIWCYEVWTPLIPNRIVDITSVLQPKTQLLQHYASQLAHKDIASMGMGLSRYRGGLLARKEAVGAEVFLALSVSEYRTYHQQLTQA